MLPFYPSTKKTTGVNVANILLDRIYTKRVISPKGKIFMVASRRETNKFLNQNLKNYLNRQIGNLHKATLKIVLKSPQEEKSLQAVDFVSWALFRKYEFADDSYYNLIKGRIVEESPLFP